MKKFLTSEEAIELLPEGETIHTFRDGGIVLIGADWEREDVIDKLKHSDKIEITGEMAREMNHGLCAYDNDAKYQSDLLFIETDKVKLDTIDPLPEQEGLKAADVENHILEKFMKKYPEVKVKDNGPQPPAMEYWGRDGITIYTEDEDVIIYYPEGNK